MSTIAIIGASPDRTKFSNKCVRAYLEADWTVFPIHPSASVIEGLTVYPSLTEVPLDHLDRVSIYLPPAIGVKVLDTLKGHSIGELWLNPGADGDEVITKANSMELNVVCGCSIVDIGASPSQFDE